MRFKPAQGWGFVRGMCVGRFGFPVESGLRSWYATWHHRHLAKLARAVGRRGRWQRSRYPGVLQFTEANTGDHNRVTGAIISPWPLLRPCYPEQDEIVLTGTLPYMIMRAERGEPARERQVIPHEVLQVARNFRRGQP